MSATPGFASRLFVSGSLAFVLIGILGAAYGVTLPAFTRAFGLEPGTAGLILTTQGIGAVIAVGAVTAGVRWLTARLSVALVAAGTGLIAAGITWPLTLTGAAIAGAGFGLIAAHVNRTFLQGFGDRGPSMVGLVNAISGLGLIAGPLIYVQAGRSTTILFGGIAVMAALLIPLFDDPPASREQVAATRAPIRVGRLPILILNHLSVFMEIALGGFGAVALIALGWSEAGAATLVSAFFASYLIGRLSLFWLAGLIGPDRLFLVGTAGTAVAALVAALGLPAVGYVASGAFVGMAFPSFYVWGSRVLGPDARMQSSIILAGLSGGAIGPLVFGGLLSWLGLPALFAAVAALGGALSIAILVAMGPARRAVSRA